VDILLVNASPKVAENNSAHFLEEIKNLIGCNHKITEIKVNKPLQMLKNWCNKTGLIWCQGIGIGAGEMLGQIKKVPLGHGPKKSLGKAFILFSENIAGSRQGENMYVSPDFPRFLFKIMADSHWNSIAKSLGVKKKDIFQNTL